MDLKSVVVEIINENFEIQIEESQFNEEFSRLGLNSVLYVQLIILLECELNIEFDDNTLDIINTNTLDKLCECLERQMDTSSI